MVVLIEKQKPCMVWDLRFILDVFPGGDGTNSVVSVKTANEVYTKVQQTSVHCQLNELIQLYHMKTYNKIVDTKQNNT